MSKLESISCEGLAKVFGGSEPPPSYNGQDVKNGLAGAKIGFRVGGPPGAVIGGGGGFMMRNLGKLGQAAKDYWDASKKSDELDAQRKQIMPQPPMPKMPGM